MPFPVFWDCSRFCWRWDAVHTEYSYMWYRLTWFWTHPITQAVLVFLVRSEWNRFSHRFSVRLQTARWTFSEEMPKERKTLSLQFCRQQWSRFSWWCSAGFVCLSMLFNSYSFISIREMKIHFQKVWTFSHLYLTCKSDNTEYIWTMSSDQ